ncbi:MAG: NADH-quinone oxidoreductase subunit G [Chromatiales bacterium]|nr:NADH-quinone oxidoreductase subunit G [Chromatiales bacterium]
MSGPAQTDNRINLEVNGRALTGKRGDMIIHVADEAGIAIPRFCYHKKLSIAANCRMCLVQVEGVGKPLPACATPIAEGMKVHTDSVFARNAQKGVMEFLLINHPLDCPICDQGGECELQDLAVGYGGDVSRYAERKRVVRDKDIGPLISTDMTRCIHCTRCVRFGAEVAGIRELGATGRGEHTEIGTFIERSVDSELSGNVIDLCPVGALTSKPFRFKARAWELAQFPTVAPHDSIGSNLYAHVRRNQVMRVVPKDNEAINETWISDRDRFSYDGLYAEDRLETPLSRTGEGFGSMDWEAALRKAGEGLEKIAKEHGGAEIGCLVSPSTTLEELYLAARLMRGLGCGNVDHRLRQTDFRAQASIDGFPGLGVSLAELESLDGVLLIGSNIRKDLPMVSNRLRKAALNGASLLFVNPIDYAFSFPVAEQIVAAPSSLGTALAGIAKAVFEKSGKPLPTGLEDLIQSVNVDEPQARVAEQLLAGERKVVLLGAYAMQHLDYSVLRSLAQAIADASGAAFGHLPEAANSAGGWIAGAIPHRGADGESADPAGKDALTMQRQALKGYLLVGVEPDLDTADGANTVRTLQQADFVVALSAYRSPSLLACADVILPMAAFTESAGTYVNLEGTWQSVRGIVAPKGDARPGWKILRVLGNLLGLDGFEYESAEQVRDELKTLRESADKKPAARARPTYKLLSNGAGLQRIGDVPIYAGDPLVRRSRPLQATIDGQAASIRICSALAERLNLGEDRQAVVVQGEERITLPLYLDDRVPDDCVWLPCALPETAPLGSSSGGIQLEKA